MRSYTEVCRLVKQAGLLDDLKDAVSAEAQPYINRGKQLLRDAGAEAATVAPEIARRGFRRLGQLGYQKGTEWMGQAAAKSMEPYLDPKFRDVIGSGAPITAEAQLLRAAERRLPGKPQHVRNAIYNALEREKANANAQAARQTGFGAIVQSIGSDIANGPVGRVFSAPFRASKAIAPSVRKLRSK